MKVFWLFLVRAGYEGNKVLSFVRKNIVDTHNLMRTGNNKRPHLPAALHFISVQPEILKS
jgi:hypothetical protein